MTSLRSTNPLSTVLRRLIAVGCIAAVGLSVAAVGAAADQTLWVHPLCQPLPIDRSGPFVAAPDGVLLTVDAAGLRSSTDDGLVPWPDAAHAADGHAVGRLNTQRRDPSAWNAAETCPPLAGASCGHGTAQFQVVESE